MGMTFRGFTSGKDDDGNDEAKKPTTMLASEPVRVGGTSRSQAMIGNGSKIRGAIHFAGQAEIDCEIEGEIEAPDTLIIGESAHVKARITGGDIVIRGTVQGDVVATKRITLKRPARVAGNLTAPNLIIEEGVLFEGKCSMASSQPASATTDMRAKISTQTAIGTMTASKVANQ